MSFDLNELSPEDIIELAAELYEDGMEKEASELPYGLDLNELSAEEFLEFADAVANEMDGLEKEASAVQAVKNWAQLAGYGAKRGAEEAWKGAKFKGVFRSKAGRIAAEHGKKLRARKAKGPLTKAEQSALSTADKLRSKHRKAIGRSAAVYGGGAAAAGGGALAVRRRRKKNR